MGTEDLSRQREHQGQFRYMHWILETVLETRIVRKREWRGEVGVGIRDNLRENQGLDGFTLSA